MSATLARTADGWWALTPAGLVRLGLPATTTAGAPRRNRPGRRRLFFRRQAANPRYLHDGDVLTATIASSDGRLDLGTQRHTVIGKTPWAPRRSCRCQTRPTSCCWRPRAPGPTASPRNGSPSLATTPIP